MKMKLMSLIGLLAIGATISHASQAEAPKMNGRLKVTMLSPEEIRYTGKPYIKELGAYAFNCRNYDPQVNRWTTIDPSGFPDGANNHLYVTNNPNSIFDNTGLSGKNMAWVFIDGPTFGLWTNSSLSSGLSSAVSQLNSDMSYADQNMAKSPHYIDDGDTLQYLHLSDISGLAGLQFTNIFLVMHGSVLTSDQWGAYTDSAQQNSHNYTTSQLESINSSVSDVYGCNPTQGSVDVSDVVQHYKLPTKSYLYE